MRSNQRRSTEPARRGSRATALIGLGLATALMLSGCSASYWPDFSPEQPTETTEAQPSNIAPVPVTSQQITSILEGVVAAAETGDAELDAAALASRFSGDALTQRTANYKIRAKVKDYGSIPAAITSDQLDYQLVQSTEGWPRTLFIVVASKAAEADGEEAQAPSLALTLTQRVPQENYHVNRAISLRGGIDMPQAAPAEEGTAVLSDSIDTLVMQPGKVGAAYAAILQSGQETEEAALFDLTDDPLLSNYGLAWANAANKKSKDDKKEMSYSVKVAEGGEPELALSTGVGGALVATTIIEEQVVDSGESRWKPQAEGAVAALSGLEGQQDRIVRKVAHQLLFFIPSKQDDSQIQLLGVTSELIAAGK